MTSPGGGRRDRLPLVMAGTALAAFATALFCIVSTRATVGLSAIWFPNGVVLGVVVSRPARQGLPILVAGCLAIAGANACAGFSLALNGVLLVFNGLGIALEAWVIRRLLGGRHLDLVHARDLASFLVPCSLLVPAVVGGLAAPVLTALTGVSLVHNFSTWFLSDAIGLLITAPVVASWSDHRDLLGPRRWEGLGYLAVACAITGATHSLEIGAWTFLAIPVLVLGTYRLGFPLAVVGTFLTTLAGLVGLLLKPTPSAAHMARDILLLQSFAITSVFTALPVGALFEALEASRRALDEQSARYHDLADRLPAGLYTVLWPPHGPRHFEYVSPQFCRLLDVEADAVLADPTVAYQRIDDEQRQDFLDKVEAAGPMLRPFKWEGRLIVRGQQRWVRLESSPTPLPGGGSRWSSVVSDITERVEAERRTAEALAYIDCLLEASPVALLTYTADGTAVSANSQAARLAGVGVDDLLKLNFRDLDSWRASGLLAAADRALESGAPQELECRVVTSHGRSLWIAARLVAFDYQYTRHLLMVAEDIGLRKQAEEDLSASARTQAVLLSEVNHRVSNNLATILGILHLEEHRCRAQGQTATAEVLAEIDARIQSLATVHSLLSSNSWGPLALGQLCGLVASNAMLSGDLQVVECRPRVQVSAQQAHGLALVLSELATNALKHGHAEAERPRVGIGIEREAGHVVLTWRDEGPGFPPHVLTAERHDVTLGLDLVRGLMQQLKGSIALSNDGGARVELRFPEWVEPQPGEELSALRS